MSPVEEAFRKSSAGLVASITHLLGPARLDLVEAVVQEAFARAVTDWKTGVPQNPAGWLHAVAKNLALDHMRRERSFRDREDDVARHVESDSSAQFGAGSEGTLLRGELDEELTMIFVACHPVNSAASQVALALRTLCGFDVPAIARALFSTEEAIDKRLVLARKRLRDADIAFELPKAEDLAARLDAVLVVLYLLFNEAYWGTSGPDIVQEDIAADAVRLATVLADHEATRRPRVLALLALMHFHAARFPARVSESGDLVTLREQDRSKWDQAQIALGLRCLADSAEGAEDSTYHYEAAIAALHVTAASHETTDWARVVNFYDALLALASSPGARLSRAIAAGFRDGPARAIEELEALRDEPLCQELSSFHAARAEALVRGADLPSARAAYERAFSLSVNPHERRWISGRIAAFTP